MPKFSYYLTSILCLLLTACSQQVSWECPPVRSPAFNESESVNAEPTMTNIYIDSTLSMEGFVRITDSSYIQSLLLLDEVIAALGNQSPQYYSLSTTANQLTEAKSVKVATNISFYQPQEEDALLEKALNNQLPKSEQLIIIVTDLLRADTDNTPLIEAFKTHLKAGYSVGIIGVRSEFDGKIYDGFLRDKGTNQAIDFNTKSAEDRESLRPFYLIFVGEFHTIINYFNELSQRNPRIINSQSFTIINSQLTETVAHFNITETYRELAPGLNRVSEIYNQQINLTVTEKELVDFLQISREGVNQTYQYPGIQYSVLPYTLPFRTNFQVQSCIYQESKSLNNCQTSSNQSELLEFLPPQIQDNHIILTLKTRESSQRNQIEVVTLDIIPTELLLPQWIEEWSYSDIDRDQTSSYLGSRTYKLRNFMQNLLTSLNQDIGDENNPIARFCFAVHKQ